MIFLESSEARELRCKDSDVWDLLIYGQDREENFVKFFVKLRATGTPNTPVRSSLLH
jgi:hypothetical protein